jgi:hypothetical protein
MLRAFRRVRRLNLLSTFISMRSICYRAAG